MPIYVLTVHASDEICKEGYHWLGKVQNRVVAAKCEFNSAFIIWAACFWIHWQESLLQKEKKIKNSDPAGKMPESGVLSINLSL